MSSIEIAILLLPVGILFICFAALWQMYVVLSEIHAFSRFQNNNKALLKAALAMFFSFSLAIYWLCPNARKKGWIFLLTGAIGVLSYVFSMIWLAPYMGK